MGLLTNEGRLLHVVRLGEAPDEGGEVLVELLRRDVPPLELVRLVDGEGSVGVEGEGAAGERRGRRRGRRGHLGGQADQEEGDQHGERHPGRGHLMSLEGFMLGSAPQLLSASINF